MIILEIYSDQQSERINGGGKCRSGYSFKDIDAIFQARFSYFEGKFKTGIMQINRIVIGNY